MQIWWQTFTQGEQAASINAIDGPVYIYGAPIGQKELWEDAVRRMVNAISPSATREGVCEFLTYLGAPRMRRSDVEFCFGAFPDGHTLRPESDDANWYATLHTEEEAEEELLVAVTLDILGTTDDGDSGDEPKHEAAANPASDESPVEAAGPSEGDDNAPVVADVSGTVNSQDEARIETKKAKAEKH